tara:strand:+ start:21342 stop:23705 length:2364 start_codon:yes stop_codon:yes gene_type:complete
MIYRKKNFFFRTSKADVINKLAKNKNLKFNIPRTYSFSLREWHDNKKKIISNIQTKFKRNRFIAIRSSSKSEDNLKSSNAGKFLSFLNVSIKDKKKIAEKIKKVIKSYENSKNLNDQVFIQEMIRGVSISGVVFTKDIETGLNYYVVNYDDITGKTDTVTSGSGVHSNRTLFIFRRYNKNIKSPRFKKLIECVVNLEKVIDNSQIDLEFAITRRLKPYLFQVRPISTTKKWKFISIEKHQTHLLRAEKKLSKIFKSSKGVLGKSTVLGQMPDWNPAEMIGKFPSVLSFSLYKKLITNNIWARARSKMNYRDMSTNKLMYEISGQPYIDTRLSLNSYLPKNLPTTIGKKIVEEGINILKKNPQFHDKIEFEISIPSYRFDIDKILNQKFKNLSRKEKKIFKQKLKQMTIEFLDNKNSFSLEKVLYKINFLDKKFKNFKKKKISDLKTIINLCKNLGTLNFSILARHGFVAKSFLNSMVNKKIFRELEIEKFEQNLNTITKKMLRDINLVHKKKLKKNSFMEKYGHLRPGTYDITSTRYDQIRNFNFNIKQQNSKKTSFKLSKKQSTNIDKLLRKEGFKDLGSEKFFAYLSSAISLREYSKFIFTKYLSLILEIIAEYGKKNNLTRSELSNLKIDAFINNKKSGKYKDLKKISQRNKISFENNKIVKLPLIIQDMSRTRVIPYQVSSPNFITHKKAKGQIVLNPSIKKHKSLNNKIIIIENADPGYDWIFGYQISGLVTKYGGINSHMSIRCSELSIPAVIGCGEQIFNDLKNKKEIQIDCSLSIIYSV